MQLASPEFLLFFVPAVLLIGACVKSHHRPYVIGAAGFGYCVLQGFSVLIPVVLAVSGSRLVLCLMPDDPKAQRRRSGILLTVGLLWLLGMILLSRFWHLSVPLPLAICVMQATEYLLLRYRGEESAPSFAEYFCYHFSLMRLWAGPVLTVSQYRNIVQNSSMSRSQFGKGMGAFVRGLAKLVLLAKPSAAIAELFMQKADHHTLTAFGALFGLFAMFFALRYGLSGMSQMGRGMAQMLGYTYPEELRGAWLADSVNEFWQQFWYSAAQWAKNVFRLQIPSLRRGVQLFVLGCVMGLLFGRGWNGIVWGLSLALLLWAERKVPEAWLKKWPSALRKSIVLLLVLAGLGILFAHTFGSAVDYSLALLGRNGLLPDSDIYYALKTNWASLLGCAILLFPIRTMAKKKAEHHAVLQWIAAVCVPLGEWLLLVLCLGTLLPV